jgi:hypothetical protein
MAPSTQRTAGLPAHWQPVVCAPVMKMSHLESTTPRRSEVPRGEERLSQPVSRVLSWAIISLGERLPVRSSNRPEGHAGPNRPGRRKLPSCAPLCLVLLPAGFTLPAWSPRPRCALTAPFHPYQETARWNRVEHPGGLFSVALSRSLQTVGVTHHGVLWSPDFPRSFDRPRSPGQLSYSG